ncbi:MAG TPA: GDSL-type esterase/lipase family protein [Bacteroidales bacterium]|nr:GDSL-type esterase/lipase family protein [Bacteroidales bacterium]
MKRGFTTLSLGLQVIIVSFILSCSPLSKYKNSVQGWEADIRKFEHLDSTQVYPGDAVLFMGSSSIRLWSTLQEDMKPYNTIQRGFGGAKISDLAWYTPRIVYPHKCQAIVIFVANDITGSDEDKTPQEIAIIFNHIVKTIRKKLPEIPIFYVEVTPTESRWKVWPRIQEGNKLVKHECEKLTNVHFIETAAYFLNENGTPEASFFLKDKLHLTREGYNVWTRVIKKNLDATLKR